MMFISELVSLDFSLRRDLWSLCMRSKMSHGTLLRFQQYLFIEVSFEDRKKGSFKFHCGDVFREGSESKFVAHEVLG